MCVKILHFDLSQKAEKRCCVLPMLEHVYAARPNFDETRNGERASEKKKEKEPQPSVYACILFLSQARDGITHSCRQCQESGVENDAETERPEHVRCVVKQVSFFWFRKCFGYEKLTF